MKQYAFYLKKQQNQMFMSLIPALKRSSIIREFIKYEYQLPSVDTNDFDSLFEDVKEEEMEVYSYYLDEVSNNRLEQLVKEVNQINAHNKTNRSAVMRNIFDKIIEKYTNHPLQEVKCITRTFTVTPGTIVQLKSFISHGDRDTIIDNFILNQYDGPAEYKTAAELKSRPKGGTESILVSISEDAYAKLEEIANAVGDKVKRSHIFKDVLEQLLSYLQHDNPNRVELEKKLEVVIEDLRNYATDGEIKEVVETYLNTQKNS